MKVSELKERLSAVVAAGHDGIENEIKGCYIGDLLSLAMSKVCEGYVWITIQTNINIVAVATLSDAGCIIIADGFTPDENTAQKADAEGIPVLTCNKSAYEIAKILAELGVQ